MRARQLLDVGQGGSRPDYLKDERATKTGRGSRDGADEDRASLQRSLTTNQKDASGSEPRLRFFLVWRDPGGRQCQCMDSLGGETMALGACVHE